MTPTIRPTILLAMLVTTYTVACGRDTVRPTRVYVYDPLLSIPEARRNTYAEHDPFLLSGRLLAEYIARKHGPSVEVETVQWPVEGASEILSTNPEDYRTGEDLRGRQIHLKILGSIGRKPGIARFEKGYASLVVSGDPAVLGANILTLTMAVSGDVGCSDANCKDPREVVRSVEGRLATIFEP